MIYIIAIILHFTFDWILQPRDIAKNKSKDFSSLANHLAFQVNIYLCLILIFYLILLGTPRFENPFLVAVLFCWGQMIIHGLIDWYLPRIFKPESSDRRMVNMVAIDQMLHLVILIGSINYLT
jgi:hypothetical protein